MRYFDSGLLLKLYVSEPREKEAEQFFYSSPTPPPFTQLHGLEMRSAVRQKLGRGEIDLAESDNQQDATAALCFCDGIYPRFKPAADQLIGAACNCEVLELRIWQVDNLHHEVASSYLLQVFLSDTDRHRTVSQECGSLAVGWNYFKCWVEIQAG